jgi:hypothetical protein
MSYLENGLVELSDLQLPDAERLERGPVVVTGARAAVCAFIIVRVWPYSL